MAERSRPTAATFEVELVELVKLMSENQDIYLYSREKIAATLLSEISLFDHSPRVALDRDPNFIKCVKHATCKIVWEFCTTTVPQSMRGRTPPPPAPTTLCSLSRTVW
jgi:hypothetical protein